MKRKKIALYDPYLDVLGGGEKHILSIIQILTRRGYDLDIFWQTDLADEFIRKFNLKLPKIRFLPNVFKDRGNFWQKIVTLKKYDLFFYISDGSYFFSPAKKNYVFAMVPDQKIYPASFINRIKTLNFSFIANSQFTANRLARWGLSAKVVYPYIDQSLLNINLNDPPKEKIILSVGRFFPHLHSKRHDLAIQAFQQLKKADPIYADYRLLLAGSVQKQDQGYLQELQKKAGADLAIKFLIDPPNNQLINLYQKTEYCWHFTGYGIDAEKHPEKVEHLGISPIEAMAAGALTFAYSAGGPKEIIQPGQTGFLFTDIDDLIFQMQQLKKDNAKQETVKKQANIFVKKHFSYDVFNQKVISVFQP